MLQTSTKIIWKPLFNNCFPISVKGYTSIKILAKPLDELFESCLVFATRVTLSNQWRVCSKYHPLPHMVILLPRYLGILELWNKIQAVLFSFAVLLYDIYLWTFLNDSFILKPSRNCLLYTKKETNCSLFIVNTWLHFFYLTWKRS